jgi:hypothetical protein
MNTNTTPTDAKGWIPTEIGDLKHPCIRGAECDAAATGVVNPYLPWFSGKGAANAWCRKVNAVATACNYGTALDIARRNGAELMEA